MVAFDRTYAFLANIPRDVGVGMFRSRLPFSCLGSFETQAKRGRLSSVLVSSEGLRSCPRSGSESSWEGFEGSCSPGGLPMIGSTIMRTRFLFSSCFSRCLFSNRLRDTQEEDRRFTCICFLLRVLLSLLPFEGSVCGGIGGVS